jgi:hypothetical protein
MKLKYGVLILCGMAVTGIPVRAQTLSSTVDIGRCATDLKLPAFSSLAMSTNPSVTVTARVHLDSRGQIQKLDFEGGTPSHHAEIRIAMGRSRFARSCAAAPIAVVFTFEITGPPTDCPSTTVSFHGPNHFILSTNPPLPNVNRTNPPR